MKRNNMYTKKIAVRKKERIKLKKIKNLMKELIFISNELLHFIFDSKIIWKIINETWMLKETKKLTKKFFQINILLDEVKIKRDIIVNEKSLWLQKNFVTFENNERNVINARNARYTNNNQNDQKN